MRQYILFGAGEIGKNALKFFGKDRVVCFCDNNSHKKNDSVDGVPIIPATDLLKFVGDEITIVITTTKLRNVVEISRQLWSLGYDFKLFEEAGEEILREDIGDYCALNQRDSFEYDRNCEYLVSVDRYKRAGNADSYFWQDLWAAKKISLSDISVHYDIGSRLDGFIAHLLSCGKTVRMIDIRPLPFHIPGLEFTEANATELESIEDESVDSISALCSLEHFGLGRYGDPIDPEACFKAFAAIQKKIRVGGHAYISVPIGKEHLEFNAHRVFYPQTIIESFNKMKLVELSSCYKNEIEYNIDLHKYDTWDRHGGERFGLFEFCKEG